jgi:hypothetical protein
LLLGKRLREQAKQGLIVQMAAQYDEQLVAEKRPDNTDRIHPDMVDIRVFEYGIQRGPEPTHLIASFESFLQEQVLDDQQGSQPAKYSIIEANALSSAFSLAAESLLPLLEAIGPFP